MKGSIIIMAHVKDIMSLSNPEDFQTGYKKNPDNLILHECLAQSQ